MMPLRLNKTYATRPSSGDAADKSVSIGRLPYSQDEAINNDHACPEMIMKYSDLNERR